MTAASFQKKIDNAHKKISKKLGYVYGLYRPLTNVNVLDLDNWIKNVHLTATISDSYTSTVGWGLPVWTVYTDAASVEEGDFLYSEDQGRTFFIISKLPHLPVLACEVNDRVNVYSVEYNNAVSGFAPTVTTPIMENLPVAVTQGTVTTGAIIPQADIAVSGSRDFQMITTFPQPEDLLNKHVVLVNTSFSGHVFSFQRSPIGKGVKFSVREQE